MPRKRNQFFLVLYTSIHTLIEMREIVILLIITLAMIKITMYLIYEFGMG